MKIDLTTLTPINFPDGTPHYRIPENTVPAVPGWVADVRARLQTPQDLWALMSIADAVESSGGTLGRLDIPYLMGARYDRVMVRGDAVDLRVVADVINRLGFERVRIFHPHSDVACALIRRAEAIGPATFIKSCVNPPPGLIPVLIVPDAGAAKHATEYANALWAFRIIQCNKSRDVRTGALQIQADFTLTPEEYGVIIDDICDGGGTFLEIAKGKPAKQLALVVTHGIFSKGLKELCTSFNEVITTDSLPCPPDSASYTNFRRLPCLL